jgi:hypothetical protein
MLVLLTLVLYYCRVLVVACGCSRAHSSASSAAIFRLLSAATRSYAVIDEVLRLSFRV